MSAAGTRQATQVRLERAVYGNGLLTIPSFRERLFTAAFQGLVYPQIWEDPVIDMEALALRPGENLVAIASGGCNILSYLTADPGRITAVDLNHAHVALNRLKLAAVRHLPGQQEFSDFFARADRPANIRNYDRFIAPNLDETARRYWQARDMFGRRRIGQRLHRALVGHVGRPNQRLAADGLHQLGGLRQPGRVEVGQHHPGPGLGQRPRRLPADPGGRAGDHRRPSLQAEIPIQLLVHRVRPFVCRRSRASQPGPELKYSPE